MTDEDTDADDKEEESQYGGTEDKELVGAEGGEEEDETEDE